jgi:hypothetical protein
MTEAVDETDATSPPAILANNLADAELQQPLRFVWSIDDSDRFSFESDEFASLIGPTTTQA